MRGIRSEGSEKGIGGGKGKKTSFGKTKRPRKEAVVQQGNLIKESYT